MNFRKAVGQQPVVNKPHISKKTQQPTERQSISELDLNQVPDILKETIVNQRALLDSNLIEAQKKFNIIQTEFINIQKQYSEAEEKFISAKKQLDETITACDEFVSFISGSNNQPKNIIKKVIEVEKINETESLFCNFCKGDDHVAEQCEKLLNKTCNLCNKKGHTENYCRDQPNKRNWHCNVCGKSGHIESNCWHK